MLIIYSDWLQMSCNTLPEEYNYYEEIIITLELKSQDFCAYYLLRLVTDEF